jgi:hypothetical protein
MMVRNMVPLALPAAILALLSADPVQAGGPKFSSSSNGSRHAVHGIDRGSAVHTKPTKHPSHGFGHHDKSRGSSHGKHDDRYHGDRHGHHDHDHHHHSGCGHYTSYRSPGFFFGYYRPSHSTHYVGCGHAAYWCERCHFHTTAIQIFYNHVHLAHHVSVAAIPAMLTWSPVNLTFIFD